MKKSMEKLLALAIVALLSAPLAAQADEGDKPVRLPPQAKVIDDSIDELELTEEQKGKYEQIYKQHVPVLQKQFEQQQKIYTPEQKTKRKEAQTKAKEQGLKGKEFQQFVQSAVQFTPEQQKQFTECETDIMKTQSKFREEVYQILTPDQQEKFPKFGKNKGKGKVDGGKDKPGKDKPGKDEDKEDKEDDEDEDENE
jgi:Spy/CpxP family protein refolding chaperone